MSKKGFSRLILSIVIISLLLILSGCMPVDGTYTPQNPANFLSGIWHGWIAPITLIFSLFNNVRIYEPVNIGFWYDFGFYMAIISGFGGLSLSRNKRNKKRNYKD